MMLLHNAVNSNIALMMQRVLTYVVYDVGAGMEEQMQNRQYMFRMSELERQMELVQQQLKLEKLMLGLKSNQQTSIPVRLLMCCTLYQ